MSINTKVPIAVGRRQVILGVAGTLAASALYGALPAQAAGGLIALVHTQAAGDAGPVDSMIAKLNAFAEEHDMTARAIYAEDPSTYETIFTSLGEAGAKIVVSTFNEVAEPFRAVAPKFPDTKFIQLFGDPFEPKIPNVATVSYDYYLGCYLSGIFAARVSRSGKLGFIGGISIPPINADYNAFKAGAQSVNPDLTVAVAFAGSFQDPAKGQEIATQMFSDGVDFIQTDAAATDFGIIAAAGENEGRVVSTLDPAQFPLDPKSVISIVGLDFGASLYNEATKSLEADWSGGHEATGLGTGVIDFIPSPLFAEQGPEELRKMAQVALASVEEARGKILDGSLNVPFNTSL
ncbi:BMP family ABC transporter substrate-binding protein [Pseudohoeflea coraliihabitans]|uniref:BMP family ABC transporter substrate-binding protein n=1 Tax=Pseudohoeflea coraliihabitans TaxID=2860393 RepID=A0ABS6WJD9_9HYPH|nr:BMP family ABC transporter substrate-binding protein [Pseudohoeflea sp. DP4N28-3]MBW3095965.1 BMP family ABC transporter substrate-binding protein [Pseudohoeflea sp. DP4N28-3]